MKTKGIFLAIMAVMIAAGGLYAGGGQSSGGLTLEKGVLSIGMEIGYPPMEYYDTDGKTPIGFDVELGKELAKRMGLEVKFVDTAWDGIFAGVDTSKYDCIISSVTITDARIAAHNFSKPYIGNSLAMVLLKGSAVRARSPEELTGYSVSYQAETTSDIFMSRMAENGLEFTPYEYDKVISCFDELQLGRVDVIMTDSLVAVDYVAPRDTPFEIVWQGSADEVFGICIKKGNDVLTAEIDKALDSMFADGTMLRLSREIFNMDMVSAARP